MPKTTNPKLLLILILLSTSLLRIYNINYPKNYVFDEVYHAFTAKEYLKSSTKAWDPWATPPPGVAYEWTHPPLAKEIMASSMKLFQTTDTWAYRLPGVILGVLSVYLVYLLGLQLLKNQAASLTSAYLFSIDGLNFVQSRVGMNDIYFVTFMLFSFLLFTKKRLLFSGIFLGLAFASKWSGIYLVPIYLVFLLKDKQIFKFIYFLIISTTIYLASYLPYFLLGFDANQFIELQKQMWWYHTNLKATHGYSSPWWSWSFNLYPVWYFVDYQGSKIANIFASGNPLMFWVGAAVILATLWDVVRASINQSRSQLLLFLRKQASILIILLMFFTFWLPWALSPRIMFLYHFAPSVPFLSLILGSFLGKMLADHKSKFWAIVLLILITTSFLFIYPFLVGIPLPKELVKLFFYTNITKNPFN